MKNYWWIHFGGTAGQLGRVFCDVDCARGGPALRVDPYIAPWGGIVGDDRKVVIPELFFNYFVGDGGRSVSLNVNGGANLRFASRMTASLYGSYTSSRDDKQPFGTFGDTAFTFAHLRRKTASINARVDYTVSPDLSIQLYASPFVSKGTFSNVRELLDPRADRYQDRFQTYGDTAVSNNPGGFNFKQFRSNVVVRWEYRPGSTLFVVWTQGREDPEGAQGTRSVMGDFGRLFNQHPDNTFLVKVSYWLTRCRSSAGSGGDSFAAFPPPGALSCRPSPSFSRSPSPLKRRRPSPSAPSPPAPARWRAAFSRSRPVSIPARAFRSRSCAAASRGRRSP
jgi:hypothetical protein